jgi:hypothetical protein
VGGCKVPTTPKALAKVLKWVGLVGVFVSRNIGFAQHGFDKLHLFIYFALVFVLHFYGGTGGKYC